ncbi:MAG: ATP-binding protein [Methanobrevibacter sp.]|jgi:putative MATE family efflux protein|nr:ATP-binding protein [Methanobrevibacter sp.]
MINKELTNKYIVSKSFRYYLFTTTIGIIAASIGMIVDGLVIGNFMDYNAIAAYGLCSPARMALTALTAIFANGGTILVSHYIGRGNKDKINQSFTIVILSSIIVSLIISVFSPFYVNFLAVILGAKGIIIPLTSDYMLGLLIGTTPYLISQVLFYFIRLDGSPKLSLISVAVMTIVNISLDILFVTVFNFGMFGIGIATSISYLIAVFISLFHFFSKKNSFHLMKFENKSDVFKILKFGYPTSLNRIYTALRAYVTNNLAFWVGGGVVLAALSVQTNANLLFSSIPMGVGMTTMLFSGIFFGEQDKKALRDTLSVSLKYGLIIITFITFIILIFSPMITRLFLKDPTAFLTASFSFKMLSLSLPPSMVAVILLNYYNSVNNIFYANYIAFAHSFLFMALFAGILTPLIGQNGIWFCFVLGEVFTLIGLVIVIKIKEGFWPKSINDLLLLNDDFGEGILNNFSISLENNMDSVMGLSNKISQFGEENNIDSNLISKLSLCVEEMVGNIIKHGFKSSKKRYIDIRIILTTKNTVIFRIRDDGIPFNPIDYANKNEFSKNSMGIHMIQKISKNIDYRNTVGLNNLTITLDTTEKASLIGNKALLPN